MGKVLRAGSCSSCIPPLLLFPPSDVANSSSGKKPTVSEKTRSCSSALFSLLGSFRYDALSLSSSPRRAVVRCAAPGLLSSARFTSASTYGDAGGSATAGAGAPPPVFSAPVVPAPLFDVFPRPCPLPRFAEDPTVDESIDGAFPPVGKATSSSPAVEYALPSKTPLFRFPPPEPDATLPLLPPADEELDELLPRAPALSPPDTATFAPPRPTLEASLCTTKVCRPCSTPPSMSTPPHSISLGVIAGGSRHRKANTIWNRVDELPSICRVAIGRIIKALLRIPYSMPFRMPRMISKNDSKLEIGSEKLSAVVVFPRDDAFAFLFPSSEPSGPRPRS
mmetsp:Transcript_9648/g.23734  ORF Transcript_9648/g.23734 Transcript_9648/m.23734 type:complete len:336 (+) Transcript_9648:2174-3181(+)